jgi:hypothetical protein
MNAGKPGQRSPEDNRALRRTDMGRSKKRAILYILLLSIIVTLSGCAQVLGSLAGAAAAGIARGVISSIDKSIEQRKAEKAAAKQQEEQKTATEASSQPQEGMELAQGIEDQPATVSPVTYDIIDRVENKIIKFNKISAVLKVTDQKGGNNKVVTKILDENELNKIIQILTKCGVYDELKGNTLLNIAFTVDNMKCTKVTYNFKYDNTYHTISVGDQKISYLRPGSPEVDLDKKLSCNFLKTIKKDISVREPEMGDDES